MIDKLHYITQEQANLSHVQSIQKAIDAGCKWVQLRVKNKSENEVEQIAIQAKYLCEKHQVKLIINDFPNVANSVNADGLHLGLLDMKIEDARKIVGNEMIIGGTANTYENIVSRINDGADYVGFGPLRFTTTKQNLSPILGIEGYKTILEKLQDNNLLIPIIAIGGIKLEDIKLLHDCGLYGVAISGLITNSDNSSDLVKQIYATLTDNEFIGIQ